MALFAYHLVKCSSKLRVLTPSSLRVHPPLCPRFRAISEFLRIFIDQIEIDCLYKIVFVLIRDCGKFCEGPLDSYLRTTQKWSFTPKTNPLLKRGLDCRSLRDTLLPAKGRRLGAPGAAIRLFAVLTDLMPGLVLRRPKELESRLWDRTAAEKKMSRLECREHSESKSLIDWSVSPCDNEVISFALGPHL